MSSIRPTVAEERWSVLAGRVGLDRRAPELAQRLGGWTCMPLLTRSALFILESLLYLERDWAGCEAAIGRAICVA